METPANPPSTPQPLLPAPDRPATSLTREVMGHQWAEEEAEIKTKISRGASWFYWIAGLSLVNSIIALTGGSLVFLAGLAVSQIADAFAANMGFAGPYFALGVDVIIAVFLCIFGYLSTHGSLAALITGMVLYALDGAIFLYFSEWAPAAFHAFALFQMWGGWVAARQLAKLRAESPTFPGSTAPPASV